MKTSHKRTHIKTALNKKRTRRRRMAGGSKWSGRSNVLNRLCLFNEFLKENKISVADLNPSDGAPDWIRNDVISVDDNMIDAVVAKEQAINLAKKKLTLAQKNSRNEQMIANAKKDLTNATKALGQRYEWRNATKNVNIIKNNFISWAAGMLNKGHNDITANVCVDAGAKFTPLQQGHQCSICNRWGVEGTQVKKYINTKINKNMWLCHSCAYVTRHSKLNDDGNPSNDTLPLFDRDVYLLVKEMHDHNYKGWVENGTMSSDATDENPICNLKRKVDAELDKSPPANHLTIPINTLNEIIDYVKKLSKRNIC